MKIKTSLLSAFLILSYPVFASPEGQEVENISLDSLSEENQSTEDESESSKSPANQGLEETEEVEKSDNEESKASLSYYQKAKAYCKENPKKCVLYVAGTVFMTVVVVYSGYKINEHYNMKWVERELKKIDGSDQRDVFTRKYFGKDYSAFSQMKKQVEQSLANEAFDNDKLFDLFNARGAGGDKASEANKEIDRLVYSRILSKNPSWSIVRKINFLKKVEGLL